MKALADAWNGLHIESQLEYLHKIDFEQRQKTITRVAPEMLSPSMMSSHQPVHVRTDSSNPAPMTPSNNDASHVLSHPQPDSSEDDEDDNNENDKADDVQTIPLVNDCLSVEWRSTSALQIFELLIMKKGETGFLKNMNPSKGLFANSVLKYLGKKVVSFKDETKLAKTKADTDRQRKLFEALDLQLTNLEHLRTACIMLTSQQVAVNTPTSNTCSTIEHVTAAETVLTKIDINLLARVSCLINDPDSRNILDTIFAGVSKDERRKCLDDKTTRNPALWDDLACIFNHENFAPENEIDDERLANIDPSKPPLTKWSGTELRTTFSKLRSVMTIKTRNFKASGQHEEGADHADGDDQFFGTLDNSDEHHAKCNKEWDWNGSIFLFIYIQYGRSPPHFVTREQVEEMSLDQGISGDILTGGGSSKKRSYHDTNQDKLIAAFDKPIRIHKDEGDKS